MTIRAIVKYHGGKGQLFRWILGNFPPLDNVDVYIEPFGGACSVLLNKQPSSVEIYNEIEPCMFHLVHTIKNNFDELIEQLRGLEYCEKTFFDYKDLVWADLSPIQKAVRTYVVKRMSRSGWEKQFSWSQRIYSRGPGEVHAWLTSLDNLVEVNKRLQNVTLENRDALDVIRDYASDRSFYYIDPPYLANTRVSNDIYKYEYSKQQHKDLSILLNNSPGKFMISGYPSAEYLEWYPNWRLETKNVTNHSAQVYGAKPKKQECVWLNY